MGCWWDVGRGSSGQSDVDRLEVAALLPGVAALRVLAVPHEDDRRAFTELATAPVRDLVALRAVAADLLDARLPVVTGSAGWCTDEDRGRARHGLLLSEASSVDQLEAMTFAPEEIWDHLTFGRCAACGGGCSARVGDDERLDERPASTARTDEMRVDVACDVMPPSSRDDEPAPGALTACH